jgi:uncharacterized protein (TIGR00730 family)
MEELDKSKAAAPKLSAEAEWKELETLIAGLAKDQKPSRLKMLNDIFRVAVKLAKESPGTLNLKITASVLKELRFSFKMFSTHRGVQKITMFGSARVPPETPLYQFAKDFGEQAVKNNYMVITGGGPGIMAAGNEGAQQQGFGLNIRLPFEQSANPFINSENRLIHYKYFFTRKLFLVKEAAAFAFFPGGFGTFDEAFEVLTLLQTGKTTMIPVVFMEPKGYGFWKSFLEFMDKQVLTRGFISENDKVLYRLFHTPKEALDHFAEFYRVYHSMRFVEEKVVIRLRKPLSQKLLSRIEKEFSRLSKDGNFVVGAALREEGNEPELQNMTRLVFPCDRKDFAGLRSLIDFINKNAV